MRLKANRDFFLLSAIIEIYISFYNLSVSFMSRSSLKGSDGKVNNQELVFFSSQILFTFPIVYSTVITSRVFPSAKRLASEPVSAIMSCNKGQYEVGVQRRGVNSHHTLISSNISTLDWD